MRWHEEGTALSDGELIVFINTCEPDGDALVTLWRRADAPDRPARARLFIDGTHPGDAYLYGLPWPDGEPGRASEVLPASCPWGDPEDLTLNESGARILIHLLNRR